jgi:predicted nucleotidyltransferase
MNSAVEANLAMIRHVAGRLGHLRERVVFLGGAATALLITDSGAPDVRITNDVDVIVEIASRGDYYRLSESLRAAGFAEDSSEGAPVCRWIVDGVVVDVMPTDEEILGFSNQWYSQAMQCARVQVIAENTTIRIVTAPYFLATKIDAFYSRGNGDFIASHDMEDIIALLDGRPETVEEIVSAPEGVQEYLSRTFRGFLQNRSFLDALPGHLLPDQASQQRTPILMKRMHAIANIGNSA